MMPITEMLKRWLVDNCEVKADADDDTFRKAASDAMVNGKLTAEMFSKLTKNPEEEKANEFVAKMDAIAANLSKLTEVLTTKEEKKVEEPKKEEKKEGPKIETKEAPTTELSKMVANMSGNPVTTDGKSIDVRVKEAAEQYSDTKSALLYPSVDKKGALHSKAGQRVTNYAEGGRELNTPSELDKAVCGAFAKYCISVAQSNGSKTIGFQKMSEHDKSLMYHAADKMKWCGGKENDKDYTLSAIEKQSLFDDGIGGLSGGTEAVPIAFDDMVISAPLLYGELFPLVNVVPIDRGRRIEGVATGQVTGAWGSVDSTAIALFNTNGYVTAFDTTIFKWAAAIRIGLDFLSDTPIDFGTHITNQIGEELLQELDDVVANGNGATQPTGVITSAGTTVAFGGVAATLGNYELLRFSVGKQEHKSNLKNTIVFAGTETSYQRARAIPVGAADARRLGGMNYDSYNWMERPYKINANLANTQIFYAVLGRYRMYRRRGLNFRSTTEGRTLVQANELLITASGRYGGQLERGAAAGRTITAQA